MEQISPLSIGIGIGLATVLILKCVLFLGDPLSCLKCLVHVVLSFVFIAKAKPFSPPTSSPAPASGCGCKKPAAAPDDPTFVEDTTEEKLSGQEVEMVMRRLGILSKNPDGSGTAVVGAKEIEVVFEDQEPSLGEVKDAFDVFDKNRDGFIDPIELRDVLGALGLREVSEVDCKRLIRAFDVNKDGLIDFREFTKLVEKSFYLYN